MYKINVTDDVAENLIIGAFNKLEAENYGEYWDREVPFFVSTFQWLNPKLKDIVTDTASMAKFLANVFTCAGMDEKEIISAAANFYGYYDDSDLIPTHIDEDRYLHK